MSPVGVSPSQSMFRSDNSAKSRSIIISPSKFLFDFYSSRGFFPNSKHKVLRNPIPFSLTQTNRNDASRPFSFLYVGQIEDHKGIVFLVDAFRQMLNLDAHLHVAGSGSAFAKVKALAEGDVRRGTVVE